MNPPVMQFDAMAALIEQGRLDELSTALRAHSDLAHVRSDEGDTLLHRACEARQLAAVNLLLENGADPNASGRRGWTPLHAIVSGGIAPDMAIVQRLLEAFAKPQLRDENGFDAAEWTIREAPDAFEEVFAAFETFAPGSTRAARELAASPLGVAFDAVAAHVHALALEAQTATALKNLIDRFVRGEPIAAKSRITLVNEAARLLAEIAKSPWGDPVRRWLAHSKTDAAVVHLAAHAVRGVDR